MSSGALDSWKGVRRERIDELVNAHGAVSPPGPGRKWNTEQLNRMLVLAVASQFQGFARDLHDIAVDVFVAQAASGNLPLSGVIRRALTVDRQLSRGNAHPGALGADFARLGLPLWEALNLRDRRSAVRNQHLGKLNEARNAIAHVEDARLEVLRSEGYPIDLPQVRRWLSNLDGLARTMDDVTSTHLADLFSIPRPW